MKPFLTLAETHTPDGSRFTLHEHDGECYSVEAHFCPAGCDRRDDISDSWRKGE
jgi:hypothetical protein